MSDDAYRKLEKEYKDFVYIISHDLNAPVRHIKAFTSMLIKTLGDDVSEQQAQYAGFIDKAIDNLEKMQAALLGVSRIATQDVRPVSDAGRAYIDAALTQLSDLTDDPNVVITIGDLPDLYGDAAQLNRVFYELVKNALTYHNDDTKKEISITGHVEDNQSVVEITDNGIGIDDEHKDDIFKIFRRLHAQESYGGGTGAGLTMAQKIIKHHGGEITISSKPDSFTTVRVCLPMV